MHINLNLPVFRCKLCLRFLFVWLSFLMLSSQYMVSTKLQKFERMRCCRINFFYKIVYKHIHKCLSQKSLHFTCNWSLISGIPLQQKQLNLHVSTYMHLIFKFNFSYSSSYISYVHLFLYFSSFHKYCR